MIRRPARRFQRVGVAAAFAGQGSDAAYWHVVLQSWRPGDGAAKYIADAETFLSPTMIERPDRWQCPADPYRRRSHVDLHLRLRTVGRGHIPGRESQRGQPHL